MMNSMIDKIMQGIMVDELSKDIFPTDEQRDLHTSSLGESVQNDMARVIMGNVQNSDEAEMTKE